MTTTAGHSFYIGPIDSFYNQVNDTGSWEPLVQFQFHNLAQQIKKSFIKDVVQFQPHCIQNEQLS
jgi:hypothetical protein